MKVFQKIANSLDENIQVTFDCPSLNEDNMVPVLDVKLRVNSNGYIEYSFYRKPCANNLLVLKESALAMKNKFTILTHECFRRLHNCSDTLPEEEKVEILNKFMSDLKDSGYNEKERKNILEAGLKTFSNLKEKEKNGERPFYRSRFFQQDGKINLQHKKSRNWFKTGKNGNCFKSVMFVEATPGDKLLKMLKETEERFKIDVNYRIKFASKSGIKLKSIFNNASKSKKTCEDECVKRNGETIANIKCKKNSVCYVCICKTCEIQGKKKEYHGETARNLHARSVEHYNA